MTHHMTMATCLILAVCSMGCAGKATIYTTSGELITGKIEGASETYLYVDMGSEQMMRVKRADVLDINHPGRGLIILGAINSLIYVPSAVAGGVSAIKVSQQGGDRATRNTLLVSMATLTSLPLAALAIGVYKWRRSSDASSHPINVDFIYPPPQEEPAAPAAPATPEPAPLERDPMVPPHPDAPQFEAGTTFTTRSWTSFRAVQQ